MASYPDKYSSNMTNSTTNRGVEAKETEIANTHLDEAAAGAGAVVPAPASSAIECARDCSSYLQVVVEKHRRAQPAPAPSRAGLAPLSVRCMACGCGCGGAGDAAPSASYLNIKNQFGGGGGGGGGCGGDAGDAEGGEAECVEVYRFLRVGAARALGGGGGGARAASWRRSARVRRGARAAAAELGAATRLAAGAPLAGALLALRWSLALARDAAAGAVHAASDYVWKPALTLAFNAVLHPLLVFSANVLRGAHEASRPLCEALAECAQHAATVLGALRLAGAPAPPAPRCRCV